MAEVELEKGCEVKDPDGDPADCFCWIVDADFEKQQPNAEDLDSMLEYLKNLDDDELGKHDKDVLAKYVGELEAMKWEWSLRIELISLYPLTIGKIQNLLKI